ncbi:13463_t:CDS:2, partial [Racocetra persica]
LPSIYEKLQTNNILQKWHYDPVRSEKDSREYSEKDYNKYKKYHRQPVDRNDPRCKIKRAVLEIVDPKNLENKILVTLYRYSYKNLNDLTNCVWYTPKYCSRHTFQDFNSLYEEVLINEFKDQIKYLELLNLLDPKNYSVQIKGRENENFCPKVIGFSANTNVRFIYDFCEDEELKPISEQKFNNTKLFSSFINRLDYIVEFKKFRENNEKPC